MIGTVNKNGKSGFYVGTVKLVDESTPLHSIVCFGLFSLLAEKKEDLCVASVTLQLSDMGCGVFIQVKEKMEMTLYFMLGPCHQGVL